MNGKLNIIHSVPRDDKKHVCISKSKTFVADNFFLYKWEKYIPNKCHDLRGPKLNRE